MNSHYRWFIAVALAWMAGATHPGLAVPSAASDDAPTLLPELAECLAELNLSAEQRGAIGNLLEVTLPDLRVHVEALIQARREIFERIHADPPDEGAIRMACVRASVADANLAVLRARLAADLRPLLTPGQQAILLRTKAFWLQRIEQGADRRWARVRSLIVRLLAGV